MARIGILRAGDRAKSEEPTLGEDIRIRSRGQGALAAGVIALLLGACSAPMLTNLGLETSTAGSGPLGPGPAPADALVGPDGRCASLPADAPPTGGGIGLDMTECDVVRRAGLAERTEIAANERGERTAVLTYPSGSHAGIYRFMSGRLTTVQRLPETAAAAKSDKGRRAPRR
jgi:hypothetical protein